MSRATTSGRHRLTIAFGALVLIGATAAALLTLLCQAGKRTGGRPRREAVGHAPALPPEQRRARLAIELGLLLLIGATAVTLLAVPVKGLRIALLFTAAALAPGVAVLRWVEPRRSIPPLGAVIPISLAIDATGSLALIWTGWFHPGALAIAIGGLCAATLIIDLRRHRRLGTGL